MLAGSRDSALVKKMRAMLYKQSGFALCIVLDSVQSTVLYWAEKSLGVASQMFAGLFRTFEGRD